MVGEPARRKLVALGIVGTGPLCESHYREALHRLSQRVKVRGVYDAVPARAEMTAREWQTVVAPSLTSLFERPEIDAVLILDSAWHGLFPLELACRFGKPSLLAGRWEGDLARQEQLCLAVRDAGVTVMTAFPRRHTPATNRLRELMATQLGLARAVSIQAAVDAADANIDAHLLTGLLDWCAYIVGKSPRLASSRRSGTVWQIELDFPAAAGLPAPTAAVEVLAIESGADTRCSGVSLRVECQHGWAEISSDTVISWQVGGETMQNDLSSERPSTDILFDQFCRRVVGGLVPVSDLSDALRALRLAEAVLKQFG